MSFENGYELGWDSEITNEGKDFVIAEPGDYEFTVISFERKRHNGSAKMPACNYAELSIKLNTSNGECIVKDKLFLHSKTEWKISEFFLGIGQKKKGQSFVPNWNAIMGATGRCKVTKRSYDKEGRTYWTNDIAKYYPCEGGAAVPPPQSQYQQPPQQYQQQGGSYVAGKF
jgi:hypothetical protein